MWLLKGVLQLYYFYINFDILVVDPLYAVRGFRDSILLYYFLLIKKISPLDQSIM